MVPLTSPQFWLVNPWIQAGNQISKLPNAYNNLNTTDLHIERRLFTPQERWVGIDLPWSSRIQETKFSSKKKNYSFLAPQVLQRTIVVSVVHAKCCTGAVSWIPGNLPVLNIKRDLKWNWPLSWTNKSAWNDIGLEQNIWHSLVEQLNILKHNLSSLYRTK